MKRYARGTDLLERALQLTDIRANDMLRENGNPGKSGSQAERRGRKRKNQDTNHKQNIEQEEPDSGSYLDECTGELVILYNNSRILTETSFESNTLTFASLPEKTAQLSLNTKAADIQKTAADIQNSPGFGSLVSHNAAAADTLNAPYSSSSLLISDSIFLDETTVEIRSHDLVVSDKTGTPSLIANTEQQYVDFNIDDDHFNSITETPQTEADFHDQDDNMVNDFVQEIATLIQKSPCSSPSLINPTSIACIFDESDLALSTTRDPSTPITEVTQQKVDLSNEDRTTQITLVQEMTNVVEKSPCSSPSMLNPTSSSNFLNETKNQNESPYSVLNSALSTQTVKTTTLDFSLDGNKTLKTLILHEQAITDIKNAPASSLSSLISSPIFLDETTGEIRSHHSLLRDITSTPSLIAETLDENVDFNCSDDDQNSNYEPDQEQTSESDFESENIVLVKKRRGVRRQRQWDRNQQKLRRMQGKNYKGLKKHEGKWTQTNSRPAREMKNACNCQSTKFECRHLTEEKRKNIHDNFWRNLNWDQRKVYIASLVTKVPPISRRQNVENSRRTITLNYYLRDTDTRFRVCKQMFLNTFDLGEKSVRMWSMKNQSGIPEATSSRPSQTHAERDNHLQSFLKALPKMESHYCRANSTKIYLEPNWGSLKEFHSFYQKIAFEDNIKPFSWTHFVQELKRQNITLFQNRKDQCDTCFAFTESRIEQSYYDLHITRKNMGRKEKSSDKILAEMDNTMKVFCVDVQAVLLSPKLNVSLAYYKIKLKLHNFTSYDLVTRKGRCYLWDEVNGGLDAEVFASLYVDLINTELERSETNLTKIVLWSDGCCYQNRNQVVSNAILNCAVNLGIVIEQKYLEHGHTFMEVDSEHSVIERKIKKKDVYIPAEYIGIIESARTYPGPYEVHSLNYNFFKDYSKLQYYTSIRPGNRAGDNVVNDIRCLKYNPDGTIQYKIMYDDDWTLLPRRTRLPNPNVELPALYNSKRAINLRKYHDLQDLKVLLHENYHSYYDTLPHECENQASCPHVKRTID